MSDKLYTKITIEVCANDFDLATLYQSAKDVTPTPGAVVTFCGLVRDFDHNQSITALELEHYPGMTEKSLARIIEQACERWPLQAVTIVHRIGKLMAGDQIVAIAVAGAHRRECFLACDFLMDYLKNDAPFWKKEIRPDGEQWVEAKDSDINAQKRWQ